MGGTLVKNNALCSAPVGFIEGLTPNCQYRLILAESLRRCVVFCTTAGFSIFWLHAKWLGYFLHGEKPFRPPIGHPSIIFIDRKFRLDSTVRDSAGNPGRSSRRCRTWSDYVGPLFSRHARAIPIILSKTSQSVEFEGEKRLFFLFRFPPDCRNAASGAMQPIFWKLLPTKHFAMRIRNNLPFRAEMALCLEKETLAESISARRKRIAFRSVIRFRGLYRMGFAKILRLPRPVVTGCAQCEELVRQ